MIPRDFIYKYMFIYLYDFANGKILLYILCLYIVIPFYFQVSDSSIVSMFITFFLILLTQPFFIDAYIGVFGQQCRSSTGHFCNEIF